MIYKKKNNKLNRKTNVIISTFIVLAYVCLGIYFLSYGNLTDESFLYLFGLMFFFAGIYIQYYENDTEYFLLFSHGLVGLACMVGGIYFQAKAVLEGSFRGDGAELVLNNFLFPIILLVVGFVLIAIFWRVKKIKESYIKYIPFLIIFIGLQSFWLSFFH